MSVKLKETPVGAEFDAIPMMKDLLVCPQFSFDFFETEM